MRHCKTCVCVNAHDEEVEVHVNRWDAGEEVLMQVIRRRGIDRYSIEGKARKRHLVSARREVVKELCKRGFKLREIGLLMGGRDHSTIIHLRDTEDPVGRAA